MVSYGAPSVSDLTSSRNLHFCGTNHPSENKGSRAPAGHPRVTGTSAQTPGAGRSHYLVQFEGQIRPESLQALLARGMRWLPKSAVMVAASDDPSFDGLPVRWVGRLEDRDKISSMLAAGSNSLGSRHIVVVEFHSDVDMNGARDMIVEHNLI